MVVKMEYCSVDARVKRTAELKVKSLAAMMVAKLVRCLVLMSVELMVA